MYDFNKAVDEFVDDVCKAMVAGGKKKVETVVANRLLMEREHAYNLGKKPHLCK